MGSAGLEWDSDDTPEKARLNQKTTFVGTGAQISGLATTYAGQLAFCTSTGSGFTADHLYQRDSANSAWVDHALSGIQIQTEASSTPVTDGADFTVTAGRRYYAFITLPTSESLYTITGIEWKNGATVSGNITCGIDIVDADPPTLAGTPLLAVTSEVAASGTSSVQRNSVVSNCMIPSGTLVGVWVSCSSGTHTLREQTGLGSQNQLKATAYSAAPGTQDTTAWTTATARKYIKLYYKGYY